jgi:hypothetical protein
MSELFDEESDFCLYRIDTIDVMRDLLELSKISIPSILIETYYHTIPEIIFFAFSRPFCLIVTTTTEDEFVYFIDRFLGEYILPFHTSDTILTTRIIDRCFHHEDRISGDFTSTDRVFLAICHDLGESSLLCIWEMLLDIREKSLSLIMDKIMIELSILTDELGIIANRLDLFHESMGRFFMTEEDLDFDFVVGHILEGIRD